MTEQEIVQALTLCAGGDECTSCPLFDPEDDDCACATKMKRAAAALITKHRALLNAFSVGFTAVPPVKVGDTVYRINKMPSINYAQLDKDWDWAIFKQSVLAIEHVIEVSKWWNKYYFAAKEEAEQALKEREGNG